MNQWDHDRIEIERHWNRLGFFWRFIILFMVPRLSSKTSESIGYILGRLFTRPDRMVKVGDAAWDSIQNFLRKQ